MMVFGEKNSLPEFGDCDIGGKLAQLPERGFLARNRTACERNGLRTRLALAEKIFGVR